MINLSGKIINNKFLLHLKSIFFIRYIILIFFIFIVLFLNIPKFFDYSEKQEILKKYLIQTYDIEVKNISYLKFLSFPPRFEINNVYAKFVNNNETDLSAEKLIIYPKLASIYNFNNFEFKRIFIKDGTIDANLKNLSNFTKSFYKLKNNILFENLNIKLNNFENQILEIKNIKLSNYGYKKNEIVGEIFNKRFKVNINNNFKTFDLNFLDSGVLLVLNFFEEKKNSNSIGNFKGKILKSNFKFDFIYDKKSLKFNNLTFRDKRLSFDGDGDLSLNPFFKINLNSSIKSFDLEMFNYFDFTKIISYKNIIKKLNAYNLLTYQSKKYSNNYIENLKVKTNLAYGILMIDKYFQIPNGNIMCKYEVNFLDEFPVLNFNCFVNSKDKKKFLKKFDIKYKKKSETFKLFFSGNLNILNKKINLEEVRINNDYKASEEDLKFFKISFENEFLKEKLIKVFDLAKIKNFINQVL